MEALVHKESAENSPASILSVEDLARDSAIPTEETDKRKFVVRKVKQTSPAIIASSRKRKILVNRKPVGSEKFIDDVANEPQQPVRDFEGKLVAHSLLGAPEEYESALLAHGASSPAARCSHHSRDTPTSKHAVTPLRFDSVTKADALDTYRTRMMESAALQRQVSAARGAKRHDMQLREGIMTKLLIHDRVALSRQQNAINRWSVAQEEWTRFKERMSRSLGKSVSDLVISKSEEYREVMEEYDLVRKATPEHLKHGSDYWLMSLRGEGTRYVPVGNIFSGLFCPVRENPHPLSEIIRRPARTIASKQPWRDNETLKLRKRQYRRNIEQLRPYVPSAEQSAVLSIHGVDLLEWTRNSANDYYSMREVSKSNNGVTVTHRAPVAVDEDDADAEVARIVEGSVSALPLVHHAGPSIYCYKQDVPADVITSNSYSAAEKGGKKRSIRILMETAVGSEGSASVVIGNNGSTALFYSFRPDRSSASRLDVGRPRRGSQASNPRFFCPDMQSSLLPGQTKTIKLSFKSATAGVFREQWTITSSPIAGDAVVVSLRGAAIAVSETAVLCAAVDRRLEESAVVSGIKELLYNVVDRVRTPEPVLTEDELNAQRTVEFESANSGLFYVPHVYEGMAAIAGELFEVLEFDEDERVWDSSVTTIAALVGYLDPRPESEATGDPELASRLRSEMTVLVEAAKARPATASMFYPIAKQCLLDMVLGIPDIADEARARLGLALQPWVAPTDDASDLSAMKGHSVLLQALMSGSLDYKEGLAKEAPAAPVEETPLSARDSKASLAKGSAKAAAKPEIEAIPVPVEEVPKETRYLMAVAQGVHRLFGESVDRFEELCLSADGEARFIMLAAKDMVFSQKATLSTATVSNKAVLLAADLDMPLVLSDDGVSYVMQDSEEAEAGLNALASTIKHLISNMGASTVVILGHKGDGKGKFDPSLSLQPFAEPLASLLDIDVQFCPSCVGDATRKAVLTARQRDFPSVLLLENVSFRAENASQEDLTSQSTPTLPLHSKEANELHVTSVSTAAYNRFCEELSSYGDVFVNDCASQLSRSLGSMVDVRPSGLCVAGPHVQQLLQACSSLLERPMRPSLAIIGGAATRDAFLLLRGLARLCDEIILTGHAALVVSAGLNDAAMDASRLDDSIAEDEIRQLLQSVHRESLRRGCKLYFPVDYVVGFEPVSSAEYHGEVSEVMLEELVPEMVLLDIGAESVSHIAQSIGRARSLVWHGLPGECLSPDFSQGTFGILEAIRSNGELLSVTTEPQTAHYAAEVSLANGDISPIGHVFTSGVLHTILSGGSAPGIIALSNTNSSELAGDGSDLAGLAR